jgi:hypothetical protein
VPVIDELLSQHVDQGTRADITIEKTDDTYRLTIVSGVTEPPLTS